MRCTMSVAVLLAMAGLSSAVQAADFALPYAPAQVSTPMVEIGSGWYLRGDVGGGFETQVQLNPDMPMGKQKPAWTGDVGFGYKLNEYLRTDFTFDYFQPQRLNFSGSKVSICPYALQGLSTQGANPVQLGYLYSEQSGTCTTAGKLDLNQMAGFANVYADLGTYFGITPYVGAGVGVSQIQYTAKSNTFKTSDGTVYNADLTPTGTYPPIWIDVNGNPITPQPKTPLGTPLGFSKQNYQTNVNRTTYGLAFNLTGGFAYNITDHAAIDVNYRYVNNGTYVSLPGANGQTIRKALETQQVRVGFRYLID